MTPARKALTDSLESWGAETRRSMEEAELVEPDEQVRSVGDAGICFANWQLALIELGNYDRDHPDDN